MAKGLFLMFPGHGNLNPSIGLVSELIANGDEVTYITDNEYREKFENVGAKFIGCDLAPKIPVDPNNRINSMCERFLDINKSLLEEAFKLNGNFDYLVIDPFVKLSSKLVEKFNIRQTICTYTTFALNKEYFEQILRNQSKNPDISKVVSDIYINLKPQYDNLANEFGIKYSKEPVELLTEENTDLKIVFTSRYFQPNEERFNEAFKFVGPSIFNRKELEDFKIKNPQNKKIVYISLGTVANENLSFYKTCIEALKYRDDLIVLMSIGKKLKVDELGEIPSNFRVYNYVPQLEVLKQTDIFITHGGMNSSSEGLYNEIPLIVVPQFGDQPIVAKRVEELGAGIDLFENINEKSISESINEILSNNSYKENAKKIGESLKKCGGYEKAVEYIHNSLSN